MLDRSSIATVPAAHMYMLRGLMLYYALMREMLHLPFLSYCANNCRQASISFCDSCAMPEALQLGTSVIISRTVYVQALGRFGPDWFGNAPFAEVLLGIANCT